MGTLPQQDPEERTKVSSTELVYRHIHEARETGRVASRRTISEGTGLPMTVVDDRVKHLKAIGRIRLAGDVAGLFEPTLDRDEDRSISATIIANGRVKLEIGDAVIEVSMREARHIGALFAGIALQFRGA
jgi:hypothetical protein